MKIFSETDSEIFSKLGRNSIEELKKRQSYYQNVTNNLSQDENTFFSSFKKTITQWKCCLVTGAYHEQIDRLSHETTYSQKASDVFNELLASGNFYQHWLPVRNGYRNPISQSIINNSPDHLTIVCEVRDGYASIFVSPQDDIIWEAKKIDSELTFDISEYNDLLEVLGCQVDLTPSFLRSHGHFYCNAPFLLKNTANSFQLPLAIPYLVDPEVVYMDLAWDALEIFLPFRDRFLNRRLPSFGLSSWIHRKFPKGHRLYGLRDEILKFVLIREQSWHGGVSAPEIYPADLTDILGDYCESLLTMFKDYPSKIHLSGWFGSSMFHNLISMFHLRRFELPPKGCITTWHNILLSKKLVNP